MILIVVITIYFILEVFGIITVPKQYSIASLFYSQIEVIATGGKILTEDNFKFDDKEDSFVNENETISNDKLAESNNQKNESEENRSHESVNSEIDYSGMQKPVEQLQNLQNQSFKDDNIDEIEVGNFYYNQLDEYGKIIYDKLYKNLDKLKTGTYTADFDTKFNDLLHQENGSDILNNSFQLAINALTFDNPELFYIDITKINLITLTTTRAFSTTYRISIGGNGKSYLADEFTSLRQVNDEISNIENIKNEILSKTVENDLENLRIVHDYLVDAVEYDEEAGKNVYNIYGTLVNKKAVCEGYARSYKLILDELGIPCIIACGLAKNSSGQMESHAWNYVKIDGNWYAVDVTWDDPVIIGNGSLTNDIRYRYFLMGAEEFFKDHFEDGNIVAEYEFEYPNLSNTNY